MNIRNVVFIVSILSVTLLFADDPAPEPDEKPAEVYKELTPEQQAAILKFLAQQGPQKRSGKWQKEGDALVCDGFLTRIENEDYCAPEVPSDWRSFEFNGKTYYVQPLS